MWVSGRVTRAGSLERSRSRGDARTVGHQGTKGSILVEGTGIRSRWAVSSPERTATTLRCCGPPWSTSPGPTRAWASGCPGHRRASRRRLRQWRDPRPTRRARMPRRDQHQGFSAPGREAMGRRTHQLLIQPWLSQARDLHRTTPPGPRRVHRPRERRHRPPSATPRSVDYPPLGHPTGPSDMAYPCDL